MNPQWCLDPQSLKMTKNINLKFFLVNFIYSWTLSLPTFLILSTHVSLSTFVTLTLSAQLYVDSS